MSECSHEPAVLPICSDYLVLRDGKAYIMGVEIKNPNECLRCGHVVTISELFGKATGELVKEDV